MDNPTTTGNPMRAMISTIAPAMMRTYFLARRAGDFFATAFLVDVFFVTAFFVAVFFVAAFFAAVFGAATGL
ncbi:MAG: hypothetical protein EB010_08505 [Acidimicrobiia bacterium]|nr:hypothetical protein [Acidimicrobiia bacterium]